MIDVRLIVFLLVCMGLGTDVFAAELRLHGADRVQATELQINSEGWRARPAVIIAGERPPDLSGGRNTLNLDFNTDAGRDWHLYADQSWVARGGHGVVQVQRNLFGYLPLRIGIPADFTLTIRSLFFGAGYRLGGGEGWNWGVTGGAQHLRGNFEATATEGPDRSTHDAAGRITLPAAGLFWQGRVTEQISAHARYSGTLIKLKVGPNNFRTDQLRLGLEMKVLAPLSLGVGYLHSGFDYATRHTSYQSHYRHSVATTDFYLKFDF
jgi:hypothetical protein